MFTVAEIKDYKNYLVNDYHGTRKGNQERWQSFYDEDGAFDALVRDIIKPPMYISHTGLASRLIDGPSSAIVTTNPQCLILPKKLTDKGLESAKRVNSYRNHRLNLIGRQSPQLFREAVMNLLLYGGSWVQLIPNKNYEPSLDDSIVPVQYDCPNPLTVFGSPEEDYGVPQRVIVQYKVLPAAIAARYPKWKPSDTQGKYIDWWEYYDAGQRYFEGGGSPVFDDELQQNASGLVPFVHAYSGFGKRSADNKPETLEVGRLAKVADLIIRHCGIVSAIDSTIQLYSRPVRDLLVPKRGDGVEFNPKELEQYSMKAGSINLIHMPDGSKFQDPAIEPKESMFAWAAMIEAQILTEAPPIMAGLPTGTSGRQEDILSAHAIRRFDSVVDAVETSFATALDMEARILKTIPGMLPVSTWVTTEEGEKEYQVTADDLDACMPTKVILKAADPIDDDRKIQSGILMYEKQIISHKTFLIDHRGMTPDDADQEIYSIMAESVMKSETIMNIIGKKTVERAGAEEELAQLQEVVRAETKKGVGSRGGPPRNLNIQSEAGMGQPDVNMAQRGIRAPAEMMP